MEFKIDEQTRNDLELFEDAWGRKSIFSCFDYAQSEGARACVKELFANPLTDVGANS